MSNLQKWLGYPEIWLYIYNIPAGNKSRSLRILECYKRQRMLSIIFRHFNEDGKPVVKLINQINK